MEKVRDTGWAASAFAAWERKMNGESKSPLHQLRRAGAEEFARRGFPTTREEEWRFTNVGPIAATAFAPVLALDPKGASRASIDGLLGVGWAATRLVFVNGHYAPALSDPGGLPNGVELRSLAELLGTSADEILKVLRRRKPEAEDPFSMLNLAFLQDGAVLSVGEQVELAHPIHILFLSTERELPYIQTPRVLIRSEAGSRAAIVVSYHSLGDTPHLTAAVTDCLVGRGATLELDVVQHENAGAFHVGALHVEQQSESTFSSTSVALGGAIVRNTVWTRFEGERSECTLNGLTLGNGTQLIDNHTAIDHASAHCTSHELYKAILDGSARGVFNGKIFVRKDAQKTDAKQTNRTLLLSDSATMDTKPQLEIVADDVKCTHGATIGQLEDEQVFYLRARGIDLESARDILTFAFAEDVIGRMQIPPVREALERILRARLRAGRITDNG